MLPFEKLAAILGPIAALINALVQAVKLGLHLNDRKRQQENEKAAPESGKD